MEKSLHLDDVIKWKHFSRLLLICKGNPPGNGDSPHKGQSGGALIFSFMCAWTNDWANSLDAGDLRRHGAHCDITVMVNNFPNTLTSTVVYPCNRHWIKDMGDLLQPKEIYNTYYISMPSSQAPGEHVIVYDFNALGWARCKTPLSRALSSWARKEKSILKQSIEWSM